MFQAKFLILAVIAALATAENNIESRIVQGHNATRGQFPFYVFLQVMMPEGMASCGASLISNQWILTAGHCLQNAMAGSVHLGTLRIADQNEKGRQMQVIPKENMYIHPKFSLLFFAWNDIALIKLPEPVEFNDVIKPISFGCSSSSNSGVDLIAIGDGVTSDDAQGLPPILQYTELKTISKLSCLMTFPFLIFRKSVVCVKGEEHRSACHGDSGGPLITLNNSLMGLTSFGSPRGCEAGKAHVFTRISSYAKWIKDTTGVECKN